MSMGAFIYYLSRQDRHVELPQLQAAGIGYAIEEPGFTIAPVRTGPDGHGGVVIGDPKRLADAKIRYKPADQDWRQAPGSETVWVGMYRADDRPRPADLLRLRPLSGHEVQLGDGRSWLVPVARGALDQDGEIGWYMALPEFTDVDEDGRWKPAGVVPEHEELWQIAMRWWDAVTSQEAKSLGPDRFEVTFDFDGINDAALRVLQANYRIGKTEVAMLRLFNTQSVRSIMDALIDWPVLEKLLKKKLMNESAPETSVTGDGPLAGTADTDQALPISGSS